jgi:diadenosine tetraphosphatase ApaH/serine/threonine PP2A family protein phosphatase
VYSTCIFCHSSLGSNESIANFPVGRRLAFDAARGRLWAVCEKCERWNLTPIEERWEAIEECERLFRSTRLRMSTDNVGLSRAADGLDLVRIGEPLRPEMAAWRYGDQFGRRRRKHALWTGAGVAAAAGLLVLGPITGVIAGGSMTLWNLGSIGHQAYQRRRLRARVQVPDYDVPVNIRRRHLWQIAVIPRESGWALRIPHEIPSRRESDVTRLRASRWNSIDDTAVLEGEAAVRAAASILPAMNETGASRIDVQEAVHLIEEAPETATLFERFAGIPTDPIRRRRLLQGESAVLMAALPKQSRLAMEMATHEDSERRALDGELALLEDAWRHAEEIAAIADDLFVPDEARDRLASLKESADNG